MQFKNMYLFWAVLSVRHCAGFSLVVGNRDFSLVAVHRLLIAVACLVEHGLQSAWASIAAARGSAVVGLRLCSAGAVVVAHRLSCSMTCGIFPNQGSNPCLLHWQMDSLPLSQQGSPLNHAVLISFPSLRFLALFFFKYYPNLQQKPIQKLSPGINLVINFDGLCSKENL